MFDSDKARTIIDSKGLRYNFLANELGITDVSLSRVLTGKQKPSPTLVKLMAVRLGVKESELMNEDTGPEAA